MHCRVLNIYSLVLHRKSLLTPCLKSWNIFVLCVQALVLNIIKYYWLSKMKCHHLRYLCPSEPSNSPEKLPQPQALIHSWLCPWKQPPCVECAVVTDHMRPCTEGLLSLTGRGMPGNSFFLSQSSQACRGLALCPSPGAILMPWDSKPWPGQVFHTPPMSWDTKWYKTSHLGQLPIVDYCNDYSNFWKVLII